MMSGYGNMLQTIKKRVVTQILTRCMGTQSAPKVTETKVNQNIRLVEHTVETRSPRPLVLILGWLYAKPKYLQKYTDMYVKEGFDVMHIQVQLNQLLVSKRVQAMMKGVLDLCQDEVRKSQPVFVHGFSVGGYVYAELLVHTFLNQSEYGTFPDRLRGHIFDSPVDFTNVPRGIARASTNNAIAQGIIKSAIELYLKSAKESRKDYVRASHAWKSNDYRIPTKIIYSLSDPVCEPELIESIVSDWITRGMDAESESWERAPHVSVYKNYPEQYTKSVIDFIRRNRPKGGNSVTNADQTVPCQTST